MLINNFIYDNANQYFNVIVLLYNLYSSLNQFKNYNYNYNDNDIINYYFKNIKKIFFCCCNFNFK